MNTIDIDLIDKTLYLLLRQILSKVLHHIAKLLPVYETIPILQMLKVESFKLILVD